MILILAKLFQIVLERARTLQRVGIYVDEVFRSANWRTRNGKVEQHFFLGMIAHGKETSKPRVNSSPWERFLSRSFFYFLFEQRAKNAICVASSAQLIAGCSSLDENISFYKTCRVELLTDVRSSREKSYSRLISLNSVPFESYFHFILLEQNLTILISFLS